MLTFDPYATAAAGRSSHFGQAHRAVDDINNATARSARQMSDAAKAQADREDNMRDMQIAMREQQRREYDSETARRASEQKAGLLQGLLSGGGMGGGLSVKRTYGGPAATASARSPRYRG